VADLSRAIAWPVWLGGTIGMTPAKATWCALTAADRAFTKCESGTAASVLALLELSEEPGLRLPACPAGTPPLRPALACSVS
jgi:hypothetical protein